MRKVNPLNKSFFAITIIVYIIALLIYGYWDYSYRKNKLMEAIDAELYNSAVTLKYILPDDFHDRAIDDQSISIKEDQYIANKLTRLIHETSFKYTYTIIKKGGKLYFVASDIAANPETKRGTFYYYPYEEADESFKKAFDKEAPTYKTVTDQWGTVRTVMVPEESPGGIKFLACVDYDISYVNVVLQKNLVRSIATVIFFLFLSAPIIILYTRQHKEYLDSLQESEARYRSIFENAIEGFFQSTPEGRFVSVNPSFAKMLGYTSPEELISSISDIATQYYVNPDDRRRYQQMLLEAGFVDQFEVEVQCKDGSHIWISASTRAVYDRDGKIVRYEGNVNDITERIRSAEAQRDSEQKFRTLVEQSPLGISLIGKGGRYKYVNPRFQEIFGYTLNDCPIGKEWFKRAYPDESYRQKVMAAWTDDLQQSEDGQARPQVYTVTCKDGSRKRIHFRPVTMDNGDQFVVYEDVTERSKMEHHLQQAQRFEAIGTLAGGIAHDFNNLLMGIQGRTSLMAADLDPFHAYLEHTKAIEDYVRSATDLTKQLLGLARGGKYEVKPVDIDELVRNSANMFGRTKKEIRIHTNFHDPPPIVEVDRSQIEQVLLNLYINAWQAMSGGGDLYLETQIVSLSDAYCEPYQAKPGHYAKVSVTDNGIGMEKSTLQRIFGPFFTTKEKGRGTGLGLASAYGIIKNHDGIIMVYSEVGHGTTFNIYLPLSDKEAYQEIPSEGKLIRGSENVLLIDDEEMILEVGKAMLEKLGYHVVVAVGGEQAIAEIQQKSTEIDLVILDLIMPGMDGGMVFDRIKVIKPQIPIILSSGYAINGQANEIMKRGCNGFIQKPFNIAELSQKVRKVLNAVKNSAQV